MEIGTCDGLTLSQDVHHRVDKELWDKLERRAQAEKTTIEALIKKAIAVAAAGPWPIRPIRYGEESLRVVLTFAHGQTVAFPLKLRDTAGISGVKLVGVTVEDIAVLVRGQGDAEGRCRRNGHEVGNVKSVGPAWSTRAHGLCSRCGDTVWLFIGDERVDVDVMIAAEVVRRTGSEPASLTEDLRQVDEMRRRLESRRDGIDEALDGLKIASLLLLQRMEKEFRPGGDDA